VCVLGLSVCVHVFKKRGGAKPPLFGTRVGLRSRELEPKLIITITVGIKVVILTRSNAIPFE